MVLFASVSMGFLKVGIILFALSAILMGFVSRLRKLFTKNKKKFLLYVLVILLLFAGTALLSNEKVLNDIPLNSFIGFQIIFCLLGILHVYVLRKVFPNLKTKQTDFWSEFLYSIVTTCLGLISFIWVVELFKPAYKYIFTASAIWFLIPLLIVKLYEFAISVPVPVYRKWKYPIDIKVKEPKNEDLINPLVISFEFNKSENLEEVTNFRLKAPEKMEFGTLFYFFINDYNERHPQEEIEFLDQNKNPYGWIFYTKPRFFGLYRHVD